MLGRRPTPPCAGHHATVYPEASPTTPIEVETHHTLSAGDQAAARPARRARPRSTTVGYARIRLDPADVRTALRELHQLGVDSAHIHLDRGMAGNREREGLQTALATLRPGDALAVANLARLARSLASLTRIIDQLDHLRVRLVVAGEMFVTLPQRRVLQLLTQFQVDLVDTSLADAEWAVARRPDRRPPHPRVDAVQSVWLQQLYDAGVRRFEMGKHFCVRRATVFRVADPTAMALSIAEAPTSFLATKGSHTAPRTDTTAPTPMAHGTV